MVHHISHYGKVPNTNAETAANHRGACEKKFTSSLSWREGKELSLFCLLFFGFRV